MMIQTSAILYENTKDGIYSRTEALITNDGRLTVSSVEYDTVEAQVLSECYSNFSRTDTRRLEELLDSSPGKLPQRLAQRFHDTAARESLCQFCRQHRIGYETGEFY